MQSWHAAMASASRIGLYQGQGHWSARPPLRRFPFGGGYDARGWVVAIRWMGWLITGDAAQPWRQLRAQEQDGLLVVATPAYQTAYQSVRPGAIKQVLKRTLATLGAAVKRGRILADTEEVTGSNPVSPTKMALVSHPVLRPCPRVWRLDR
jgi:hypothetical protein